MPKVHTNSENRVSPKFQERLLALIDEEEDPRKNVFIKNVGLTQDVIIRATIYAIVPSVKSLIKIADYFDVSLSYLLGKTDTNDFYKSENPTTFHIRLRELSAGKKYGHIARTMPFSRNLFYDWLREGTLPCLDYLEPLAKYFNVSMDYLLGRTDYKN